MSRLILIRHANTFEPEQTPYWVGLREDIPLSKSGNAQLPALRSKITDLLGGEIPSVISSPLMRAKQTAEILGFPVINDNRLAELDFGPWSGLSDAQIIEKFGAEDLIRWRDYSVLPASWKLSEAKINSELSDLLNQQRSEELSIAVTSNGRLKLIGKMLGGDGTWNVKTAQACELEAVGNGWRILRWNF